MSQSNGTAHAWTDLSAQLQKAVGQLDKAIKNDTEFQAFANTRAITKPVTFGIKAAGSNQPILITVEDSKGYATTDKSQKPEFTLVALPEQWEKFFEKKPEMPYQSYWGMFGMNIKQKGIEVEGDWHSFACHAHFWRRSLELLHDLHAGTTPEDEDNPESDEDHITGKYVYIKAPIWGKCKVFYEMAGENKQEIVFLHTAGSDSRQYHGVMNDSRALKELKMYAFDLPGHGRSFPSNSYAAGAHTNTEDSYVGCIAAFVKALGLNKPIICGASMAGQICLAVAVRAQEVGAGGTIPLQGSDYLNMDRLFDDRSPTVNQALWNPEWIYGMMSPTAPLKNRQLIWHLYSGQAYGIFHGDLDFYFGGWDGRSRMKDIDTKKCPVYMLTGEYDWSNTPEMSQKTADKIKGGKHEAMKGLGHFPATENPKTFVGYLLKAVKHIQDTREG